MITSFTDSGNTAVHPKERELMCFEFLSRVYSV